MRSTRATAAVERLKKRSDNPLYSFVRNADGMFYLVLGSGGSAPPTPQSAAMPMEDFIEFVNAFGPQKPKRVSKLDLAFEAQLSKENTGTMMQTSYWEQDGMLDADFIVIGGGLIGLQTALELRQREPRASIVLLERGLLQAGASSRNAGFACFGSLTEILADIEALGEAAALALVERRWRGLHRLRQRLDDEALGYEAQGGYELLPENRLAAVAHIDTLNATLRPLFGQDVFALDPVGLNHSRFGPQVKALVRNSLEGQIHSGRALRSLTRLATSQGIEIHTGTEVVGLEDNGTEVCVQTAGERGLVFRAGQVAVCTSGLTKELLPECGITPGRGQVLVTAPIVGLPWRGTYHLEEGFFYFRNIGDRVLLGGGRHLAFKEEETSEMALTVTIQSALEKLLQETILPGRDVEITHRWAGIMGFSGNGKPIVRRISERIVLGFGCNGMGVALSTEIAAETAALLTGD